MGIQITKDRKNPLMGRREVEFQMVSKVTPSRKEAKAELAKTLKANEALIVIDSLLQKSGSNVTMGLVKVYDDEKIMKRVELAYKSKRGLKEKKAEAGAAPEKDAEKKSE